MIAEILHFAPSAEIVLVTTRADDAVLSVEDFESIKVIGPNNYIKHCVPKFRKLAEVRT